MSQIGTQEWLDESPEITEITSYAVVSRSFHIVATATLPQKLAELDSDVLIWGPGGIAIFIADKKMRGSYTYISDKLNQWLCSALSLKWEMGTAFYSLFESFEEYFREVSINQIRLLKNKGYSQGSVINPQFPCFSAITDDFCLCVGGLTIEGNAWVVKQIIRQMRKIYEQHKDA